jgi:hypothetical protein
VLEHGVRDTHYFPFKKFWVTPGLNGFPGVF